MAVLPHTVLLVSKIGTICDQIFINKAQNTLLNRFSKNVILQKNLCINKHLNIGLLEYIDFFDVCILKVVFKIPSPNLFLWFYYARPCLSKNCLYPVYLSNIDNKMVLTQTF